MPVLFVGHGSAMNAIGKMRFTETLTGLSARLPRPKARLCGVGALGDVGSAGDGLGHPPTIHDLYASQIVVVEIQFVGSAADAFVSFFSFIPNSWFVQLCKCNPL